MNQQAAALGLANTHAVNVTGLDADGQFSSANDMTRLAAFLMGNQTFQLTVARTDATLNGQTIPSTNDLLTKYPGADGVKTGHTTQRRVVHRRLGDARRPADHRHRARRADRGGPRRRRDGAARLGVHPALSAARSVGAPWPSRSPSARTCPTTASTPTGVVAAAVVVGGRAAGAVAQLWVVTASAAGRPHALPVWGVWDDDVPGFAWSCAPRLAQGGQHGRQPAGRA